MLGPRAGNLIVEVAVPGNPWLVICTLANRSFHPANKSYMYYILFSFPRLNPFIFLLFFSFIINLKICVSLVFEITIVSSPTSGYPRSYSGQLISLIVDPLSFNLGPISVRSIPLWSVYDRNLLKPPLFYITKLLTYQSRTLPQSSSSIVICLSTRSNQLRCKSTSSDPANAG